MSEKSLSVSEQLNLPFEYNEYGVNYDGAAYVGQQSMVDRLNEVLGFENWELEPLEIKVNMDTHSVSVLAKLNVYDAAKDRWISRTQYGNDTMTILQGETEPRAQAIEDAKKSAVSDSLKKCASWLGCASDVFKGKVKAIKAKKSDKSENPLYIALVQKFGLNPYNFPQGLVILPESYRSYYEEKNWNGIFETDLANAFSDGGSSTGADQSGNTPVASDSRGQNAERNGSSGSRAENRGGNGSGSRSGNSSRSTGNGSRSTNSGNGGSAGTGSNASGSNSPKQFRIKALSKPKKNQDGTAIFDALLETSEKAVVMVPKELAQEAIGVVVESIVINVKGWLKETNGTVLKLAKTGSIEVEKPSQSRAS